MSVAIPEGWEYWVADPEIAEVLGESSAVEFSRDAFANIGFRFGRPDGGRFRVSPERPSAGPVERRPRVLPDVVCPCGSAFRPRRATTVYCSNPCRKKYVGLMPIRCAGCNVEFRPKRAEVMFCSRPCSNRATAASRPKRATAK
jgi:hypothetical protein